MSVEQVVKLDIVPQKNPPHVRVTEYDKGVNGWVITAYLYKDGEPWEPPDSAVASVEGTKANGAGFKAEGHIMHWDTPCVMFTLTESMTDVSGAAWAKIVFTINDSKIATCGFWLDCDRAGVEAETVIGAPGFEEQINTAVDEYLDENDIVTPIVVDIDDVSSVAVQPTEPDSSEYNLWLDTDDDSAAENVDWARVQSMISDAVDAKVIGGESTMKAFGNLKYVIPVRLTVPKAADGYNVGSWSLSVQLKKKGEYMEMTAFRIADRQTSGYRDGVSFYVQAASCDNYTAAERWTGKYGYYAQGSGNGNFYDVSAATIPVTNYALAKTVTVAASTSGTASQPYLLDGTYNGYVMVYDKDYTGAPAVIVDGSVNDYVFGSGVVSYPTI